MNSSKYVNLACGSVFINSPEWINLDFEKTNRGVKQANLLGRFPLQSNKATLCYSSHFFEHIPKSEIEDFLKECFRVLMPGGVIRLVLPDLENIVRTYLSLRDSGKHEMADFVVLELIDQCVRRETGGELGRYYDCLRESLQSITDKSIDDQTLEMVDFIRERTGEDLRNNSATKNSKKKSIFFKFGSLHSALYQRILKYWIHICILALPSAFRSQNVSLTAIGENHQWMWDFYQLRKILENAGFVDIQRQTANNSILSEFPYHLLDLDPEGQPRKGNVSMYIEAIKP